MARLRLHVWGPAFGLASIDAECLAAITYLAYAVPIQQDNQQQQQQQPWALVATSPSAVPTHALPALHDGVSDVWVTGFQPIVRYLSSLNPRWDLDAHLHQDQDHHHHHHPQQQQHTAAADLTAYTTFLQTTAPPLLALSLYVSSANWAATTRPALSSLLPFPLAWTEPPALRTHMCDVAVHLGLSDLNIDATAAGANAGDTATATAKDDSSSSSSRGFLKIPERLRPAARRGVRAALSPEQTALFRLEAAAGDGCLAVLEHLKRQGEMDGHRFFFFLFFPPSTTEKEEEEEEEEEEKKKKKQHNGDGEKPTSFDCLAFAYLSLMLVPEVPRPWLRDLIRRRYECLSLFVDGVRDEIFGGGEGDGLPWLLSLPLPPPPSSSSSSSSSSSQISSHHHHHHHQYQQPWRLTRFARGVMKAILPNDYLMPRERTKPRSLQGQGKKQQQRKVLRALLHSFVGASLLGGLLGAILHREYIFRPFGSLVYRWQVSKRGFGAAGAIFGI